MESRFNDRFVYWCFFDFKFFIFLLLLFFVCWYEGEEREVIDKMVEIIF